ncbi:MAG: hypothetical protein FWD61_15000, partial [Phycisphaerales bacterium]|nr:hypothetical protein [Phycisphaerales bacterium]
MGRLMEEVRKDERAGDGGGAGGLAICFLLALVQFSLGGYQLGFGNQPIQITFLRHWADPTLFTADEMVRQTLPWYPTLFFRMLAPLLHVSGLEPLYLLLQLMTGFLTLVAVYLLGRSIFRGRVGRAAATAAVCLMVAGHHRGLALEGLYTPFFTHTLAALPVALLVLTLMYRGKTFWAMALAGVLFNIHALTAAYAMLMVTMATLADVAWKDRKSWWRWGRSVLLGGMAFGVLALPTLWQMAMQGGGGGQFFVGGGVTLRGGVWGALSFPGTGGARGNRAFPRFPR